MPSNQISSQPPPEPLSHDLTLPSEQPLEPLEISANDRMMALLCHVGGFFTSVIVPLVLYLTASRQSRFSIHHAREALNYQISQAIYAVVLTMLGGLVAALLGVTVGWEWAAGTALAGWVLIAFVLVMLEIVLVILASLAAWRGQYFCYPLCLRPIR